MSTKATKKLPRPMGQSIRELIEKDQHLASLVEDAAFEARVASSVREARLAAGLSQSQLADAIGTKQSAISRIESADYDGHSLSTLRKIGRALGCELHVEFYQKLTLQPPQHVVVSRSMEVPLTDHEEEELQVTYDG